METKIDRRHVRQRIDWIRRQQGLSQQQFARKLNISQPAVSQYLNRRIPPADVLLRIARLGQTTVEWILTGQKSYLYQSAQQPPAVAEATPGYDAEWHFFQKMNRLPPEVRQALHLLIDHLVSATPAAPPPNDAGNSDR